MVLTGEELAPGGQRLRLRLTIEQTGAGAVLQTLELSRDGGGTWKPAMALEYRE